MLENVKSELKEVDKVIGIGSETKKLFDDFEMQDFIMREELKNIRSA